VREPRLNRNHDSLFRRGEGREALNLMAWDAALDRSGNRQELAHFPELDAAGIEDAIARALGFAPRPGGTVGWTCGRPCCAAGRGVLRADKARYRRCLTPEMGKPIVRARARSRSRWTAGWIADNARVSFCGRARGEHATLSYVRFQPLGVILAVMPWNFRSGRRFAAGLPALAAGT